MKQFLKFIAYLQIIGIILVVLGHSFHEYPDGEMGRTLPVYRMIYSFHMPLFMFVSGFLMVFSARIKTRSERPGVMKFIRQKILRLLLPFTVLTLVTFIPRSAMSGIADDSIEMTPEALFNSFFYGDSLVIPFFWFLQASFILLAFNYTVMTLGEKARVNNVTLYLTVVLLFVLLPVLPINFGPFFSINEAVRLGIFFALGATYSRFAGTLDRLIPWTSPLFLAASVLLWVALFFVTEGTLWIRACSLAGIIMCVSVAKLMERHGVKVFDHLIGSNYLIFLLSWYCNVGAQQVLSHLVELPWWCYTVLSLVSGIYIPWLGYRYLQSHPDSRWIRVTAFLLGQSIKKTR